MKTGVRGLGSVGSKQSTSVVGAVREPPASYELRAANYACYAVASRVAGAKAEETNLGQRLALSDMVW